MLRIFGMIWGYIYCFFLKIFYKKFIPAIKSHNNEEEVFKRKNKKFSIYYCFINLIKQVRQENF